MSDHFCQYIVDFHMEPGEDGDPIFCDKPASIKWDGVWFCAEHYDLVTDTEKPKNWRVAHKDKWLPFDTPTAFWGIDIGLGKDATFAFCYGDGQNKP